MAERWMADALLQAEAGFHRIKVSRTGETGRGTRPTPGFPASLRRATYGLFSGGGEPGCCSEHTQCLAYGQRGSYSVINQAETTPSFSNPWDIPKTGPDRKMNRTRIISEAGK